MALGNQMYSFLIISISLALDTLLANAAYLIGQGIADVTGPAGGVNMMGYANPAQLTGGIHLRLFSRAFIFADVEDAKRVVFVSADICMGSELVKLQVINRLQKSYGDLYNSQNFVLSGTHTHSGPAGYNQYVLLDITSLGFVNESFVATVDGIVKSIELAHENLREGNIFLNEGELLHSNINRSPTAYENNPKEERNLYKYDVDKTMSLVKLVDERGTDLGMINWFAVHPTSMKNTNRLISGDNKGFASYLTEQIFNKGKRPGRGSFVAAFSQSNNGDTSPNTNGAHCQDTGLPCERNTSTCNGRTQMCIADGPGSNMFESTEMIGSQQHEKALELYNSAQMEINGPVDYIHQFVDMSNIEVVINEKLTGKTCKPAMGYSFAAGTTDGPGAFDFTQGMVEGNEFWDSVRDSIKEPSLELIECHAPKPILLPTGEASNPYAWHPTVVDLQILRIGNLVILAVPGEYSTMAGRRLRESIYQTMVDSGFPVNTYVVIAGLSNIYTHYITTFEEYQVQRYEGASNIYGPYTLKAQIQEFKKMAIALAKGEKLEPGPLPDFLLDEQLEFLRPPGIDNLPFGKEFGDVLIEPAAEYRRNETVTVTFVSSHPRNHPQIDSNFLSVEIQLPTNKWIELFDDSDWSTRFHWEEIESRPSYSQAVITWDVPDDAIEGIYRISHYGSAKRQSGTIEYTGISRSFTILDS